MEFLNKILEDLYMPKVVKVKQIFDDYYIKDVEGYVRLRLSLLEAYQNVQPGMSIAITGGSRGLDAIDRITKTVCDMLKEKGAHPFIVPAMGSHGGATAEGQTATLAHINNMTEETMGVPIKSSMEVVQIGETSDHRPIFIDKYAHEADGIVLINRIKAHTSFRGTWESGLMKMMAIGLGKQHGASFYHKTGFKDMPRIIGEVGHEVLRLEKILFGIGTLENAFGKVCEIACLNKNEIPEREKELLKEANNKLAKTYFRQADVLVIKKIGKDISGCGHDPNVTGRFNTEYFHGDTTITKMALLDLTEASDGNAAGIGTSDLITRRLYNKINFETLYPNVITSTVLKTANVPIVLEDDETVVKVAVKTSNVLVDKDIRMAFIESTKHLDIIYVSENMVEEAMSCGCEVLSEPFEIPFDKQGNLELEFE